MNRRQLLALGGFALAGGLVGCNSSQTSGSTSASAEYPVKRVSFIVPFPAGSGPDGPARIIVKELEAILGTRIVVENVDGGRSLTGLYQLASKKPDGATLGWASASGVGLNARLTPDNPFKGPSMLTGIAKAKTVTNAIVADPSRGWKTLDDVIAAAKAEPGKITVGVPEASSSQTIQFRLFAKAAGLDFQIVAYGGGKNILPAVNGTVDLTVGQLSSVAQFAEAGKLNWIATVGGKAPAELDVPSVEDAGYDTSSYQGWEGVVAPAGLPAELTTMLSDAVGKAVESEEYQKFSQTTFSVADFVPSPEFSKQMQQAYDNAPAIIEEFDIKG